MQWSEREEVWVPMEDWVGTDWMVWLEGGGVWVPMEDWDGREERLRTLARISGIYLVFWLSAA